MTQSKNAAWIAAAVVVALVIGAGGWFLMISPRLESAASMDREARAEQDRIDMLQVQLAGLAADFENIDTFREELADLRVQMPTDAELADLSRQLDTLAATAGVVVQSVQATTPTSIEIAAAPTTDDAGAATAEGDVATDDGTTEATDPAVPAPPATTPYFVIPIQIMTIGGFEESVAFVESLQEQSARLVLLSGVVSRTGELEGALNGMPAMGPGTIETTLTVYVFAMPDDGGSVDAGTGDSADATLPSQPGARNPFAPAG